MKQHAIHVTGHRKLQPFGYEGRRWWDPAIDSVVAAHHAAIQRKIYLICEKAISIGYNTFISGGAIGADQLFAEAVLALKFRTSAPVQLIIARPFPSQHIKWHPAGQERFFSILKQADQVVDVCDDPYAPWKMQKRNEWMVEQSIGTLAVWNGATKGGTWNCVNHAASKGREIIHLDAVTLETSKLQ